jgi:hypothetical protein
MFIVGIDDDLRIDPMFPIFIPIHLPHDIPIEWLISNDPPAWRVARGSVPEGGADLGRVTFPAI